MAIPDYQTLMLPVLKASAAGEVRISDVVKKIGADLGLTPAELAEEIPSGGQSLLSNRVHWAKTYLANAKLVDVTKRGHFAISSRGKDVLAKNPAKIDRKLLSQFPEFTAFIGKSSPPQSGFPTPAPIGIGSLTPDQAIESAKSESEAAVAGQLLDRLRTKEPKFFERTIKALLVAMSYGGGLPGAAKVVGKSGDGGIDVEISEDALGLDRVLVQAKRYAEKNVGPEEVQAFAGAIETRNADKGVLVTTSGFTKGAHEVVAKLKKRIILIDGKKLVQLMIEHRLAVITKDVRYAAAVDESFFDDEGE